jgi:TetR/AcrR family transcriptional regulator, regulator of cefoperazone and chloramphenicol sensitivity
MVNPERAETATPPSAQDARQRLVLAGLQLFAHQGYSKTSTRELAEAAQVNVAAISYYFGDKAGLYRAVFFEPLGEPPEDFSALGLADVPLADALRGFFAGFLEPMRQGEMARLCVKLHMREMLEPTGLWDEELRQNIQPSHQALLLVLCRHLGLAQADQAVQRLAICLAGLAVHVHLGFDVTGVLAPDLNRGADAVDRWTDALVMYGLAMVQAEQQRRTQT